MSISNAQLALELSLSGPSPSQGESAVTTLRSVRIQRFKRIADAAFDVEPLNVMVGANNSGKSSIIQGLHFGVALLQTIRLSGDWPKEPKSPNLSRSVNSTQLIYSPSEDASALGAGGRLLELLEHAATFDFTLSTGETCSVNFRKGKNRNIIVSVSNQQVAYKLSSLEQPFSIFSPGLAGIAKRENYVSDGILLRTLARGDANLVLRNILWRLWNTDLWSGFMDDLHYVFPHIEIKAAFEEKTAEFIDVQLNTGAGWVPLELAGTGILQAMQILSYIHRFSPSIVVLDEPDSHLHPNNQRLLCTLLRKITEERQTQVLLTTHSRHVVDTLGQSSGFLWVRNGSVDIADEDDELGVLMEIGALDIKERASQSGVSAVVLTEDEITGPVESIIFSSGFDSDSTVVLPYYGVTGIKQLRPLTRLIMSANPKAKIILHRDRDYLTDAEVSAWETDIRALGVEPFVTKGLDIESYFLNANLLASANTELDAGGFDILLKELLARHEDDMLSSFVRGRTDVERKSGNAAKLDPGRIAVDARKALSSNAAQYAGKSTLSLLRKEFQRTYAKNLRLPPSSPELADPRLAVVASKLPKGKGGSKEATSPEATSRT